MSTLFAIVINISDIFIKNASIIAIAISIIITMAIAIVIIITIATILVSVFVILNVIVIVSILTNLCLSWDCQAKAALDSTFLLIAGNEDVITDDRG